MRLRFMLLSLFLLFFSGLSSACGGFFCQNTPIDQSAERIIFTVNGDGTLTAIVGIGYEGNAEDFSWVVPVPSPPELDVAETASLDVLQQWTEPQFILPEPTPCAGIFSGHPDRGGGGLYTEKGSVGPYDYVVIGGRDVDELVTWLRDNGYRVEPEMEPIIGQYIEEGMLFLAMKLSQDAEVGDIQPVVMTYKSEQPMIPLRLTAIAATDDMPVLVWIFGQAQYTPVNYAAVTPDFGLMRGANRIRSMSIDLNVHSDDFYSPRNAYQILQDDIQTEHDGRAFITEFAGRSDTLFKYETYSDVHPRYHNAFTSREVTDPFLIDLIYRFPYVTRLRAQLSPEQMTIDPVFEPAPKREDVSQIIDLNEHVDPIDFYGCSTRTVLDDATRSLLPEGFTRFDDAQFAVRHPEDWQVSELEYEHFLVTVLAPEAVTEADFEAHLAGESAPPMFFFIEDVFAGLNGYQFPYVGLPSGNPSMPDENHPLALLFKAMEAPYPFRVRSTPQQSFYYSDENLFFGILADDEIWEAEDEIFIAMLDYAGSFDFYLSDKLRHTLMISEYIGAPQLLLVPYPEGWTERMIGNTVEILADDGTPVVRVKPLSDFVDCDSASRCAYFSNYEPDNPVWGQLANYMQSTYNVDVTFSEKTLENLLACEPQLPPDIAFETDERRGILRITPRYLVEVSAPGADYDSYENIFIAMLDAMQVSIRTCFA